jgi:hypothetical protein
VVSSSLCSRQPDGVDHDCLAVDEAGAHRKAGKRFEDAREAGSEIVAVAAKKPHAVGVAPRQDAEAVVFDLMHHLGPIGGSFAAAGRDGETGRKSG